MRYRPSVLPFSRITCRFYRRPAQESAEDIGRTNGCQGRHFGIFVRPIPLTTNRPLTGTLISQTKNAILLDLACAEQSSGKGEGMT